MDYEKDATESKANLKSVLEEVQLENKEVSKVNDTAETRINGLIAEKETALEIQKGSYDDLIQQKE
jgi:hypothetical protein